MTTPPDRPPQAMYSGWSEQYWRMRRGHMRLRNVATGAESVSTPYADDALVHFFQDALHLRDWIKNDPAVTVPDEAVTQAVKSSAALSACADLANGSKHFRRDGSRQGVVPTNRHISVSIIETVTGHGQPPPQRMSTSYVIATADGYRSALELAGEIVEAWDAWLVSVGLTPDPTFRGFMPEGTDH